MRGTHHSNQDNTQNNLSSQPSKGTEAHTEAVQHPYVQSDSAYSMPSKAEPSQESLGFQTSQPIKRAQKRKSAKAASPRKETYQPRLPLNGTTGAEDQEISAPEAQNVIGTQSTSELTDAQLLAGLGLGEDDPHSDFTQSGSGIHQEQSMAHAEQVWRSALSELAMNMPPATFDTWMRDTKVIGYEDGEFIIGVPNAYACDWIKNRLRTQIKRTLVRLQKRSVQVTVRVVTAPIDNQNSSAPFHTMDENSAHSATNQSLSPMDNALAASEEDIDMDDVTRSEPSASANPSMPNNTPGAIEGNQDIGNNVDYGHVNSVPTQNGLYSNGNVPGNSNGLSGMGHGLSSNSGQDNFQYDGNASIKLNAFHTFDTFVVGNHNRMVHAAAEAISDRPGASFNPLFVYGGVGLGKTHLLHAIGNRARQNGFNILYCTSEQFTNELILAIRGQSTEHFRNKYRHVDILLIDDIQFIGGKESTQEEFFHTFNHLHAAGKQVILSSDRPPKALPTLEERLRSRFEGGLQTDISKPDFETRVAILQSKAATIGMDVEPAALMLLAERVDSNIRELEGALNRIALQAKLFSNRLDVALTESVLKNLAPERTLRTPAAIIEIVAEHFHLTVEALKSRSRTKDIAHARQIAMYLLREENAMSLPSIGDHLGGRDHSTVRHGVEKIIQDIDNVESVRHQIMTLREKVYAAPGF